MVNGQPHGLRIIELDNWNGQAIASPRSQLKELLVRAEANRMGIYILSGPDISNSIQLRIYIGEGVVSKRLAMHDADPKKDYWVEVVFFVYGGPLCQDTETVGETQNPNSSPFMESYLVVASARVPKYSAAGVW